MRVEWIGLERSFLLLVHLAGFSVSRPALYIVVASGTNVLALSASLCLLLYVSQKSNDRSLGLLCWHETLASFIIKKSGWNIYLCFYDTARSNSKSSYFLFLLVIYIYVGLYIVVAGLVMKPITTSSWGCWKLDWKKLEIICYRYIGGRPNEIERDDSFHAREKKTRHTYRIIKKKEK